MRLRRWTYLTHRWCGVAGCVLMALWFASGIVMLFVGYPKLTPWDRSHALPALASEPSYRTPEQIVAAARMPPERMTFNAADGRSRYVLHYADGSVDVFDAVSGERRGRFDATDALRSAGLFLPQADATYVGAVQEDRWTHSRGLDPHRPLYMIRMHDADATLLYVSSHTGEVVMQAPRMQRLWNFAGAWLHWLYMFKNKPVDDVWTWTVILLSAGCVLLACSGILVGVWRWRFAGRYKSGSRSPYQTGWMRWHHLLGLTFSLITLTWIFSGLMSMNPLGIFSAGIRPDIAAYAGGTPAGKRVDATPSAILQVLRDGDFHAVELEWKTLNGKPFVLARDAADNSRLVVEEDAKLAVLAEWPVDTLQTAAAHLMTAPIRHRALLAEYDAYFYRREPEAMMGGSERRLPVLKFEFGDAGATQAYIDVRTGQLELSADRAQRVGRWLFSFLHSWDLRPMLEVGWLRELILVLLSLGGLALSTSAIVVAWRRVKHKLSRC
ncbi:PepSY domain-containing protein [Herbaspirillum sp. RV1423]|uniref:PepSY domain-containing protein n=1 Tax=Herbaspirillum sp. RV1423 TaxID=1443993 RepID=UPI0004B8AF38|nr:PepSY domain-containing protein [Herbaspirillum sp. RV1423]